jgi:hypothetical protein
MLEVFFCSTCQEELCSYGDIANETFEELCEDFILKGSLKLGTQGTKYSGFYQILEFLEFKGFVVTTDNLEGVYVRPCGLEFEHYPKGSMCTICIRRDIHENDFDE